MRDKYGANNDKYCYQDTGTLINILNIRDAEELEEAEVAFTTERYRTYQSDINELNQLDFSHLKRLHLYLFQDLYSWAGKVREIDISKGNTRFCTFSRIEPEAEKLFKIIPTLSNIASTAELIENLASLFCELNLLHPFREGNGRTLRFFFEELLFVLGYEVRWPQLTQQDWIDANVAGVYLDLKPLVAIFEEAILPQ
ncbi:Fic/DOC family protein [Vibrio sp. SCSIO 43137]|uniref:Fic/DOC family protein n=1 Tax=Vibrio sp. SCSIO 43137 TaxID=3021011 RepID=UPI002307D06D|nr:Fic family protein [Vibrio sp. SCSIO 43137]WCE32108.1 Fic family protein [Vibrio sp. SCSIO 43137]